MMTTTSIYWHLQKTKQLERKMMEIVEDVPFESEGEGSMKNVIVKITLNH